MNTYDKRQLHQQKSVALKYEAESSRSSPKVIAKGSDSLAQEIIALAKEHDILIHEDEALLKVLSQFDLGQEIPEDLYTVIAELIAFSYVLKGKFPEEWTNKHKKIDFLS